MASPFQRAGGWCEPVRQSMCMAHPGAFRLNECVRVKRLTPLPVSALMEAVEGLQG